MFKVVDAMFKVVGAFALMFARVEANVSRVERCAEQTISYSTTILTNRTDFDL